MKMRGRNRKWFGTGSWGTVREVGVVVVFEFSPRVGERRDHHSVRGENSNRSRRGSVNGEERAVGRKLVANFFFLNIEELGDMFNHLFMGKGHLQAGWTVRRRRCDNVGGVAGTVDGRGRARWDEDGGRRTRHCWAIKEVMEGVK